MWLSYLTLLYEVIVDISYSSLNYALYINLNHVHEFLIINPIINHNKYNNNYYNNNIINNNNNKNIPYSYLNNIPYSYLNNIDIKGKPFIKEKIFLFILYL